MKKYAKNLQEYDQVEFDEDDALKGAREVSKKRPTSVALDEATIIELKSLAHRKGIPYQVLMRSFILDGIEKMKKEAS